MSYQYLFTKIMMVHINIDYQKCPIIKAYEYYV